MLLIDGPVFGTETVDLGGFSPSCPAVSPVPMDVWGAVGAVVNGSLIVCAGNCLRSGGNLRRLRE